MTDTNTIHDLKNQVKEQVKNEDKKFAEMTDEEKREHLKIINVRGLSGITNIGNTCYMNAALQSLFATRPLLSYLIHTNSDIIHHIRNRILKTSYEEYEKNNKTNEKKNEAYDIMLSEISKKARKTITYKLHIFMKHMMAHNCEVTPNTLKRYVNIFLEFFNGMNQHDSQEFLTAILDKIHEETKCDANIKSLYGDDLQKIEKTITDLDKQMIEAKQKKDIEGIKNIICELEKLSKQDYNGYLRVRACVSLRDNLKGSISTINDIFSGMFMTKVTCSECKKDNYRFDRFDIMTLHLPEEIQSDIEKYELSELLDMYVKNEKLTGNNQYNCSYCNSKRDAFKEHRIYLNPKILVIMIKKYQKFRGKLVKSNFPVKYPHELDMSKYMTQNNNIGLTDKYELYSVIRHSGGMHGGHYYSYTKNSFNDKWYLHDDDDVYNVDSDEPLKCNGYVLFYKLK